MPQAASCPPASPLVLIGWRSRRSTARRIRWRWRSWLLRYASTGLSSTRGLATWPRGAARMVEGCSFRSSTPVTPHTQSWSTCLPHPTALGNVACPPHPTSLGATCQVPPERVHPPGVPPPPSPPHGRALRRCRRGACSTARVRHRGRQGGVSLGAPPPHELLSPRSSGTCISRRLPPSPAISHHLPPSPTFSSPASLG